MKDSVGAAADARRTERPILFSAPMVRALLAGTKTQTRRVVKGLPERSLDYDRQWFAKAIPPSGALPDQWSWWDGPPHGQSIYHIAKCPYGVPGDTLWVRESFRLAPWYDGRPPRDGHLGTVYHEATLPGVDERPTLGRLRPSIHMPRWASRITLQITDVRVERLNDISEADARAEGIVENQPGDAFYGLRHFGLPGGDIDQPTAARAYASLWDHINGPGSWAANPWVWAVSFARATSPASELIGETGGEG